MAAPYDYTTRVTERDPLDEVSSDDELLIVDKSDLSGSPEGTDKKINPRELVEGASVRPSTNQTVEKTVSEWVGELSDDVNDVKNAVQPSSPTQSGTVRLSSDAEAVNKDRDDVALNPKNLKALGATETLAGLLKAMSPSDTVGSPDEDRGAITPKGFFQGIMGDSVFGTDEYVFKIPVKDNDGNTLVQLTVQYGEREANSVASENRPESDFNHAHPFVDIGVTFPQPFPVTCLMVIPMGYNVNDVYEEGTEFVYRELKSSTVDATIRASRIEGDNKTGERIGVKYLAIGF